jgi:YD repeat-containing protein
MKKSYPIILFINLFFSFGSSFAQKITVIEGDTLLGKVRQLKYNKFEVKEEFGDIKKTRGHSILFKCSQLGRIESVENVPIDKKKSNNDNILDETPKISSKVIGDTIIISSNCPDGSIYKNLYVYSAEKIIESKDYKNDSLDYVKKYQFNKSGNLISESRFNGDGTLIFKENKKFEFNDKLIESENFSNDSYYKVKYNYDFRGRLLKSEELDLSDKIQSTITYKYNNLTGRLTETLTYNNGIRESSLFEYDTFGRLLSKTDYSNGRIDSKEVFIYDQKGLKIESTNYIRLEKLAIFNKSIFSYFANGLLQSSKEIYFNQENSTISSISIKAYEYDKMGNYVKLTESSSSSDNDVIAPPKAFSIIEREIEYY